MLAEARGLASHGEWGPFLKQADVPVRTAQRMLKIAGAGLKCDTVSHLGGTPERSNFLRSFDDARRYWQEFLDDLSENSQLRPDVEALEPRGWGTVVLWLPDEDGCQGVLMFFRDHPDLHAAAVVELFGREPTETERAHVS